MTLGIDDARFQELLEETLGSTGLSANDTRDLIAIAQLAAWIGLEDDREESTVLDTLTDRLSALGGIDATTIRPISPVPIDHEERIARVCTWPPCLTGAARASSPTCSHMSSSSPTRSSRRTSRRCSASSSERLRFPRSGPASSCTGQHAS